MSDYSLTASAAKAFVSSQNPTTKPKQKLSSPFTIRFSEEERSLLDERSGAIPLGAYIRDALLGEKAKRRRKQRKPRINDEKLAFVISLLGNSRIASNLNQLAKHANIGTLEVSEEVERELHEACVTMLAIRNYLLDIDPTDATEEEK